MTQSYNGDFVYGSAATDKRGLKPQEQADKQVYELKSWTLSRNIFSKINCYYWLNKY